MIQRRYCMSFFYMNSAIRGNGSLWFRGRCPMNWSFFHACACVYAVSGSKSEERLSDLDKSADFIYLFDYYYIFTLAYSAGRLP